MLIPLTETLGRIQREVSPSYETYFFYVFDLPIVTPI